MLLEVAGAKERRLASCFGEALTKPPLFPSLFASLPLLRLFGVGAARLRSDAHFERGTQCEAVAWGEGTPRSRFLLLLCVYCT